MKNYVGKWIIVLGSMLLMYENTLAWDLHTLIAHPIFSSMDEVTSSDSVRVRSLDDFLISVESELALTLEQEETWARENLEWYTPLPDDIAFQSTGNPDDIRKRFIEAVRINPESKIISYLQLLPGDDPGEKPILLPGEITPLKQNKGFYNVVFVGLSNEMLIDPLSVLVTSNDEPDMGLDIGLYENNGTPAGQIYGFGIQPFGNPNLEYGSQAPIHMGLYHEADLVNKLAPYISHCLPEYRIHLYKTLSELAFREGQDYWGWRFMGWGLHYIADLAQPYHTAALPGVSVFKMLTMNFLDILGMSGMKDNAIQLVSNRHTAIESFGRQLFERAHLASDPNSTIISLRTPTSVVLYTDDSPRSSLALKSNAQAKKLDLAIAEGMPAYLVSDPDFELGDSPDQREILQIMEREGDLVAIQSLESQLNELLQLFSIYGRSYVMSILSSKM